MDTARPYDGTSGPRPPTGLRPRFADKLADRGIELPTALFTPGARR